MTTCAPLRELNNASAFADKVSASSEPTIVTRNGTASFIALSLESYDALCQDAYRARFYERLALGEQEEAVGAYSSYTEFSDELRARYGL